MTVSELIDDTLRREGSAYTDHPTDKPTKYGITPALLADDLGVPMSQVTKADIQALTEEQARGIYRRLFERSRIILLGDEDVQAFMFDWAVHAGVHRAVRHLQRVLGVDRDSVIGADTVGAATTWDSQKLLVKLKQERWGLLWGQIKAQIPSSMLEWLDETDFRYLNGWVMRLLEFVFVLWIYTN